MSYYFAFKGVNLLHHPGVELDGISDVSQDLLVGMGRLLVQQDPHSFAGLHTTSHHSHKLWTDEVLDFTAFEGTSHGAAKGRRSPGGCCRGFDIH